MECQLLLRREGGTLPLLITQGKPPSIAPDQNILPPNAKILVD
jgi:hypothetical protein